MAIFSFMHRKLVRMKARAMDQVWVRTMERVHTIDSSHHNTIQFMEATWRAINFVFETRAKQFRSLSGQVVRQLFVKVTSFLYDTITKVM